VKKSDPQVYYQKPLQYRGIQLNFCFMLNGKLGDLRAACCLLHPHRRFRVDAESRKEDRSLENVVVEPLGGVAGRAGAMRAIVPSITPNAFPRKGRRKPTPRSCAAGAGGVTTIEKCVGAAAKLRQTTRTRRRFVAARISLQLYR
jgi:hypothetical protein